MKLSEGIPYQVYPACKMFSSFFLIIFMDQGFDKKSLNQTSFEVMAGQKFQIFKNFGCSDHHPDSHNFSAVAPIVILIL